MKRLMVTHTHGWTVETVKEYERTVQDPFSLKRVMAIRLVMEGRQGVEVATLLNLHRQSVSTYVKAFNQGGMNQLLERKSPPGRSPYLSEIEVIEVKRWLTESTPAEEGFGHESYWDTRILQYALEERFHITMSRNGITDMLHRWGFSYTRPTYRLQKADVKKQEHFRRDLDMVKKTSQIIDETHIRDYQALHATWNPIGKQKLVPTHGHHAKVSLFGAVNADSGEMFCMESPSCNAETFLQFLEYLLQEHPNQHLVLVLDNARIHYAKLIQPFLKENKDRLTLLFLPPYSPNLNPLERVWKWLKESVISNRFHASQKEIRASILSFLEHLAAFPNKVLQRMGVVQMLKD